MPILRLIYEGRRPEIPKEISSCQWLNDLLKECWQQDPIQRPTASQVVDTLTVRFPCRRRQLFAKFILRRKTSPDQAGGHGQMFSHIYPEQD